jgi:hypothetical protein
MDTPNILNDAFEYAVWIPDTTPSGQRVAVRSGERSGAHIMHAESPDLSELYFEVTAYAGIRDHDDLARGQQAFLEQASADGTLSPISYGTVGKFFGVTFDFAGTLQGRWKERRFLFLDGRNRTYRIVHDPSSALNVRSLESLDFDNAGGT